MKYDVGALYVRKTRGRGHWRASFDWQRRWYSGATPRMAASAAIAALLEDLGRRADRHWRIAQTVPLPVLDVGGA